MVAYSSGIPLSSVTFPDTVNWGISLACCAKRLTEVNNKKIKALLHSCQGRLLLILVFCSLTTKNLNGLKIVQEIFTKTLLLPVLFPDAFFGKGNIPFVLRMGKNIPHVFILKFLKPFKTLCFGLFPHF